MAVKKHKTVKPPTDKDILVAKFHACMCVDKLQIDQWSTSEIKLLKSEFSFEKFKELLVEYKMQEYAILLMNFLIWHLKKIQTANINDKNYEAFKSTVENEVDAFKELTELLHLLLSSEKGNLSSISFNKQRGNRTIKNQINLDFFLNELNIVESLKKEFEDRTYNLENLTYTEAKESLLKKPDLKWIEIWFVDHDFHDKLGARILVYEDILTDSDYVDFKSGKSINGEDIIRKIIHDYSESHVIRREVTQEYIENLILELTKQNKKDGAPEKKELKLIMQSLSYLVRIDRFLDSAADIQDIEQINLSDEDCKFIFDCLDFFNLLDKEIKSPKSKFIRSRLNSIKTPYTPEFFKKNRIAKFSYLKFQITSK